MNPFVHYIAALHVQDLLEDARLERRAKLSTGSQPSVPAWRRSLGGILASVARSLDPNVDTEQSVGRGREGGVGRALVS